MVDESCIQCQESAVSDVIDSSIADSQLAPEDTVAASISQQPVRLIEKSPSCNDVAPASLLVPKTPERSVPILSMPPPVRGRRPSGESPEREAVKAEEVEEFLASVFTAPVRTPSPSLSTESLDDYLSSPEVVYCVPLEPLNFGLSSPKSESDPGDEPRAVLDNDSECPLETPGSKARTDAIVPAAPLSSRPLNICQDSTVPCGEKVLELPVLNQYSTVEGELEVASISSEPFDLPIIPLALDDGHVSHSLKQSHPAGTMPVIAILKQSRRTSTSPSNYHQRLGQAKHSKVLAARRSCIRKGNGSGSQSDHASREIHMDMDPALTGPFPVDQVMCGTSEFWVGATEELVNTLNGLTLGSLQEMDADDGDSDILSRTMPLYQ